MGVTKFKKNYIIGIDEVGRGPLAGPVTVVASMFQISDIDEISRILEGITDSKKLSEKERDKYFEKILGLISESKINIGVGEVSADIIDKKGIQFAIQESLQSALFQLPIKNIKEVFLYLDGGLYAPPVYDQETVIKGDQNIFAISLASVYAKVFRDKYMIECGAIYPEYGFEKHKGYGTKAHREAIQKYGVCEIHRKTWIKS